jgi:hypothetical protein
MDKFADTEGAHSFAIIRQPRKNIHLAPASQGKAKVLPIQRAGRPPRQSTPDRLTLRWQGIGGGVS